MWQHVSNIGNSIYKFFKRSDNNSAPLLYETINDVNTDQNRTTLKYKRIFYRLLTVGAVTLDTIFVVFLYHAMRSAIEYASGEFGIDSES